MKTITVQCSNCGKNIQRKPSLVKYNKTGNWFCDRVCTGEFQTKQKSYLTCPICSKEFYAKPYRKNNLNKSDKITCSYECRLAYLGWGSKIIYCDQCGEGFRRKNAEIKTNNFCSRDCMGQWQSKYKTGENSNTWKGGYQAYYGKDWHKRRRQARKRDNYTCQGCNISQADHKKTLEVHHIKPVRLFDNSNDANHLDNLITLCRDCHVKADVLARWFFDQNRRDTETFHPLQSNSHIGWLYLNPETPPPQLVCGDHCCSTS